MPRVPNHPVRLARVRLGITQQALAELAGMNRSSLTGLEEGRTKFPSEENLRKLAAALKTSPLELTQELTEFHRDRRRLLTNSAKAVLKLSPSEVSRLSSFVAWRKLIAPTATAFASLLGVQLRTVSSYEAGNRIHGMPDTLATAIFQLGVSDDYIVALANLEPQEEL